MVTTKSVIETGIGGIEDAQKRHPSLEVMMTVLYERDKRSRVHSWASLAFLEESVAVLRQLADRLEGTLVSWALLTASWLGCLAARM